MNFRPTGDRSLQSEDGRYLVSVYGPEFGPQGWHATAFRRNGTPVPQVLGNFEGREAETVQAAALARCEAHAGEGRA